MSTLEDQPAEKSNGMQVGQLDFGRAGVQLAGPMDWPENCAVGWVPGVQLGWTEPPA